MCGIAGIFGPGSEPGLAEQAERLRRALRHRGPDDEGMYFSPDGRVGLVQTRLAILDLTAAGHQPMEWSGGQRAEDGGQRAEDGGRGAEDGGEWTEDGGRMADGGDRQVESQPDDHGKPAARRCWIVFNGEIYNFRDLRKELEGVGERFSGHSDTEVLLRLLVREGRAALPKLAGMFAFAFWDESTGRALLARDGLGIKPLYVRHAGGGLEFASESRVLRAEADDDAPDAAAVRDFLLWGSVPEPATLSAGLRQVPAGGWLEWDGRAVQEGRWYQPQFGGKSGGKSRPADPVAATRAALEESIARHLVSDVPVGIFLSGGIDSTAILALARQALGPAADIRTFSIGFDDPAYDESSAARRTAEHFGARHTEWRMTAEEGAAEIPAYLAAMDQPGIDGFNTWCVSKLARREGMKVVLSGLGGDELFGGYETFRRVPQFLQAHRLAGPLRPLVAALLEKRPAGSRWRRLAEFFRGPGGVLAAYHAQRGIFTEADARVLVQHLLGADPGAADWHTAEAPENRADAVSWLELTRYMRNQLLRDSDVYSMAHGLELRVPLVDVRLFDALSSIPASVRLRQGKQLLLNAVPEIPNEIARAPKRGFRFPFQEWFATRFGKQFHAATTGLPVAAPQWYQQWCVFVLREWRDDGGKR